jgi:Domain of unknown function (DUF4159)
MTRSPVRARFVAPVLLALVLAAVAASAQRIMVTPGSGFRRVAPKFATPDDFDGSFIYCRGFYTSRWREAGGTGWWTDYPAADNNFSVRLMELTLAHVKLDVERQPNTVVVRLTDPLLYRCPMLFMEDTGTVQFTDREVDSLRTYFQKGGFLWVDDFWGSRAWDVWTEQIGRVLPPSQYSIFDIPPDHPIMHSLYDVKEIPQVPSINFWMRNGGRTSERGSDSPHSNFRGINDDRGRLMVVMTHNTDIADTWEREGENHEYFQQFSPAGYAIGVNVVLYAMMH